MNSFRLIIAKDANECGVLAADCFEKQIFEKPDCVLGLATGSTPLPIYKELIAREKAGRINFSKVKTVNLDEYKGLAATDKHSYRYYMQNNLFDHISINPDNTIVPDGLSEDASSMCKAYEDQIKAWGGIDLQLLGIGNDGHIGFNEPSEYFSVETHAVELTKMTREANGRFFDSITEVPTVAYTMGIGTVMAAEKILLVATGHGKAGILAEALYGRIRPELPASILQLHHNVTVICDTDAAAQLQERSA